MFASLAMYLRAETASALDEIWVAIRDAVRSAGLPAPETLSQDQVGTEAWSRSDMVLSQTCGMPFRKKLHPNVALVGTLDHGVAGCPAGYYNSAIIKKRACNLPDNPRPAINDLQSQSGYAALREVLPNFKSPIESGAHLKSARMVAEGTADIAAIDAVTWRLIEKYDAFSSQLEVLKFTKPTPALPLITGLYKSEVKTLANAIAHGLDQTPQAAKDTLGIKGLVHIHSSTYLKVKP